MTETDANKVVMVTREELPMHCSGGEASWDGHPRVFIPLEDGGEASCSYCGNRFRLVDKDSSE